MDNQGIDDSDLLTPQEHMFVGSTSNFTRDVKNITPQELKTFYTPEGLISGKLTLEQVIEGRKKLRFIKSAIFAACLGFDRGQISVSLVDLNRETGETCQDPRVLGVWDTKERRMKHLPGRDLTRELYARFTEVGIDLHLRPSEIKRETEVHDVKPESKE